MPFSDADLRALTPGTKFILVGVGNSLFVFVESVGKGGGKSFVGRTRFPPGRSAKQVEVQIGPYGKGAGKWTLKAAREEWERIRTWSKDTGRDPREMKKGADQEASKMLDDAIQVFLSTKTSLRSSPSPTTAGNWKTTFGRSHQGQRHFENWNGATAAQEEA